MNIKPNHEGASFDVVAVLDPLSQGIPRLVGLFIVLYQVALLV